METQEFKGRGVVNACVNVRWEQQPFYFLNCGMSILRVAAGASKGDTRR